MILAQTEQTGVSRYYWTELRIDRRRGPGVTLIVKWEEYQPKLGRASRSVIAVADADGTDYPLEGWTGPDGEDENPISAYIDRVLPTLGHPAPDGEGQLVADEIRRWGVQSGLMAPDSAPIPAEPAA